MSKFTQENDSSITFDIEEDVLLKERKGLEETLSGFPIFQEKIQKTAIMVDPNECRPWQFHNRDMAWLTQNRCADLIASIKKHGQHQPALVRPLVQDAGVKYEIIYGVRRWFACSVIPQQKLLTYVAELDDKTCTILMHTENANSKDITEFERACSFAQQLHSKIFKNQMEMAEALDLSQGNISKMVRASEIFSYEGIQDLFDNKLDIPIKYAYILSIYLKKPEVLPSIMTEASVIINDRIKTGQSLTSSDILKRLINIAKSKQENPSESIILTRDNIPIVSCKRDKFGKVHIVIDHGAKNFSRKEIEEACAEVINKFVFLNYSPENIAYKIK